MTTEQVPHEEFPYPFKTVDAGHAEEQGGARNKGGPIGVPPYRSHAACSS
jgi:hypothetical protein